MTPAKENQLVLEHKFLARVKVWLEEHYPDGSPSGFLHDDCAGMVVNELFQHWILFLDDFSDEQARNDFIHDLDEAIDRLRKFRRDIS